MQLQYSKHISWQLLNNKVYIIDEITEKVYELENAAKDFWTSIETINSLDEIIESLSKIYNVSKDILMRDMTIFTNNLISQKLVVKGDTKYE